MNGTGFSATDLNKLERQLDAWRRQQGSRARLPDGVWTAAATLAQSQGVSWVARTLRLDYCKLARHRASRRLNRPAAKALPTFVEVQLGEGVRESTRSFRVELAGAHGARMSIGLGHDTAAVVALAEAFWRHVP